MRLHDLHAEVSIIALPFGRYGTNEDGQHVTVSSWRRVDDNIIPARGKIAGAYVNSAFVKTDANRAGFDEALVLNQDGHISEGSAANLFLLPQRRVGDSPDHRQCSRRHHAPEHHSVHARRSEMGCRGAVHRPDRSLSCRRDVLCGTGVQIAAITKVDHRNVGTGQIGRPDTIQLRDFFMDVVHGRNAKYRNWCYPIYEKAAGP